MSFRLIIPAPVHPCLVRLKFVRWYRERQIAGPKFVRWYGERQIVGSKFVRWYGERQIVGLKFVRWYGERQIVGSKFVRWYGERQIVGLKFVRWYGERQIARRKQILVCLRRHRAGWEKGESVYQERLGRLQLEGYVSLWPVNKQRRCAVLYGTPPSGDDG